METNDHVTKPSQPPTAAESSTKPPQPSRRAHLRALLDEILTLVQSGENPSRLQELLIAWGAERVRRIDEELALVREQFSTTLYDMGPFDVEFTKSMVEASRRPDLTLREAIFLQKWSNRYLAKCVKSLLDEKESIERKRRPSTRGRRGAV